MDTSGGRRDLCLQVPQIIAAHLKCLKVARVSVHNTGLPQLLRTDLVVPHFLVPVSPIPDVYPGPNNSSSVVIKNRLFSFGGWVPVSAEDGSLPTHETEWKCTNSLSCLNLGEFTGKEIVKETFTEKVPENLLRRYI